MVFLWGLYHREPHIFFQINIVKRTSVMLPVTIFKANFPNAICFFHKGIHIILVVLFCIFPSKLSQTLGPAALRLRIWFLCYDLNSTLSRTWSFSFFSIMQNSPLPPWFILPAEKRPENFDKVSICISVSLIYICDQIFHYMGILCRIFNFISLLYKEKKSTLSYLFFKVCILEDCIPLSFSFATIYFPS